MADDQKKTFHRFTTFILLGFLAAFLSGAIVKIPPRRTYQDREPVYFWHMWTSGWKDVVEGICNDFNESQDQYEVIPLSIPSKVADSKFLLSTAGGAPPDCMAQWNQVVPQFAESRVIMPLDEILTPEELKRFKAESYPVALKIATYEDRLYCVPLALDIRACYYRLDHLHKAGLLPPDAPTEIKSKADFLKVREMLPKTLEELNSWGAMLHIFDEKGRLARLGYMPQWFRMFAPVYGGGFYNWDTKQLTINTPENLKALHYLADQQAVLGFENMLRFRSSLTGRHGANWPFAIGKESIMMDGQWRVQQLRKFAPDLPYVTSSVPPPEAGGKEMAGWVHGNFMVIPKGASNPKGAWEFIKFWTGRENPVRAAEFYTQAGWLPPIPSIAETQTYRNYIRNNPEFLTFVELLDSPNVEPTPPVPFQLLLFDEIKRMDESVMRGTISPEKALVDLEEIIDDEMQRREHVNREK